MMYPYTRLQRFRHNPVWTIVIFDPSNRIINFIINIEGPVVDEQPGDFRSTCRRLTIYNFGRRIRKNELLELTVASGIIGFIIVVIYISSYRRKLCRYEIKILTIKIQTTNRLYIRPQKIKLFASLD